MYNVKCIMYVQCSPILLQYYTTIQVKYFIFSYIDTQASLNPSTTKF